MVVSNKDIKTCRVLFWDNIKGLLIFLVVLGHCFYELKDDYIIYLLTTAIYFVHMPAFIFISGYFSKSSGSRSKESLLKYILSYFLVISLYVFIDIYYGNIPHLLSAYYSEWYLLALIIFRLVSPLIPSGSRIILYSIGISVICGFWPDLGGNVTLSINKVITFFPFFIAGYNIDARTVSRVRSINKKHILDYLIGSILVITLIFSVLFSIVVFHTDLQDLLPYAYEAPMLIYPIRRLSFFGISTLFIIVAIIYFPDKKIILLTNAGKNSFAIYLIHRPLTIIFGKILQYHNVKSKLIISILFSLLLLITIGSDMFSYTIDKLLTTFTQGVLNKNDNSKITKKIVVIFFIILILSYPCISIFRIYITS